MARYQHATIFVGTMLFVLGGRTNSASDNVLLDVYETESSEWFTFDCVQRFRHVIWAIGSTLYMHGGFEKEAPNIPTNSIVKFNLLDVLASNV